LKLILLSYIEGGVARCKKTIEVVYEKSVFKPLEKVELVEGERTRRIEGEKKNNR